jgi:predicted flap endonuclease-1-like 5' DNA nuclease
MVYLIETYWAWSLVSLFCGGVVGYWWLRNPYRYAAVKWALVAVAAGLIVAVLQVLPGRAGLYLETLLLLLLVYIVGVLLGGWLRRGDVASPLPAYAGPVARGDRGERPDLAAAEDARIAAEARAAEDARIAVAAKAAEDARLAAEAKAVEDARLAAEAKAAEDARLAAEAKAAEDARMAAEAKAAEAARIAAEAKAAEDARLAAEAKAADDARMAAEVKAAEAARIAAEAKAAEDARIAAEAKAAEDARIAAEAKAAEDARIAAEAKAAEDSRIAAEAKAAEDSRIAAEAKAAEDARIAAEAKAAEDARIAAEAKAAEDARIAAEARVSEPQQDPAAQDSQDAAVAPYPGVRPIGIAAPRDGKADDLKFIKGIGPRNEGICNDLGIYHLAQIADWTADEATWVGHHIAFPGRIEREHWVDQAKLLAAGGETEHSAGVRAGAIGLDTAADNPLDDSAVAALRASLPAQAASVEGESKHHGRRPYGLLSPHNGRADDLQRIRGIGPQNERRLHALGIWHFNQIAAWSAENVAWIGSYLAFAGRIDREKWIDQAKDLAAGRGGESAKRKSTKPTSPGPKQP